MKKVLSLAGLAAGLTMMASVANAQEAKPLGFAIRLGLFFPTSDIGTRAGKNWIGGGFEYGIGSLFGGKAGKGTNNITVDAYSKGDLKTIPIQLNYVLKNGNTYTVVGAGVSLTSTKRGANTENSTEFAYSIGFGREFKRGNMPFFAEVRWMGNGESDLSGWLLTGGVRF